MVGAVAGDDLVAVGAARLARLQVILARDLEGDLVGLGAAGGEVDASAPAQQVQNLGGQPCAGRVGHGRGEVGQFGHLRGRGFGQLAAAVADI